LTILVKYVNFFLISTVGEIYGGLGAYAGDRKCGIKVRQVAYMVCAIANAGAPLISANLVGHDIREETAGDGEGSWAIHVLACHDKDNNNITLCFCRLAQE